MTTEDEIREAEEALWIQDNSQRDPIRDVVEAEFEIMRKKLAMFDRLVDGLEITAAAAQSQIDCERFFALIAAARKLQGVSCETPQAH